MNQDQAETIIATVEAYYTEIPAAKAFVLRAALMDYEFEYVIEAIHRLARVSKWVPMLAEILVTMREVQSERVLAERPELPDVTWTPEEEAAAREAAMASYREFVASHPPAASFITEAMAEVAGTVVIEGGESGGEDATGDAE